MSGKFSGQDLQRYRKLFNGARAGDVDLVRGLLSEGLLVNCAGPRGATPLHIAARFNQPQMVGLLIAHKADPAVKDDRGYTPLDKARASGTDDVAKQLQGATMPKSFDSRCRKLLEAAHRGDVARLTELVNTQPDVVNSRGPRGATALHVAARYGHAEAVEALLRLGADPAATDNNGHTATDKARQLKHERVLAPLLATLNAAPVASAGAATERPKTAPAAVSAPVDEPSRALPVAQETLRLADAKGGDAPARAAEPAPAAGAGTSEVVLWVGNGDGDGGVSTGDVLATLAEVRPLRAHEVVWLTGQGGAAMGCCVPLRRGEHTASQPLCIGRARTCALALNDQEVSGTHAALWWDDESGEVLVADKPGSFNGTFIRLASDREPSASYPLQHGDVIGLGCVGPGGLGHWLTFESGEGEGGEDALQVRNTKEAGSAPTRVALVPKQGGGGDAAGGATFGVGRAASNDLVLKDQAVSGSHAQLVRAADGRWSVRDLGSSNGTCLRLSAERIASRPFRLSAGHSVLLGLGPKCSELSVGRFRVGIGERRGRRPSMEDAHVAIEALPPPPGFSGAAWPQLSFYAVYDGHGGGEAAEYAKAHLHRHLIRHLAEKLGSRRGGGAAVGTGDGGGGGVGDGVAAAPTTDDLAASLRDAFLSTDKQLLTTTTTSSGATAVACLVTPTHILVGNAGDSRAVIWREKRALRMSVDHKPVRRTLLESEPSTSPRRPHCPPPPHCPAPPVTPITPLTPSPLMPTAVRARARVCVGSHGITGPPRRDGAYHRRWRLGLQRARHAHARRLARAGRPRLQDLRGLGHRAAVDAVAGRRRARGAGGARAGGRRAAARVRRPVGRAVGRGGLRVPPRQEGCRQPDQGGAAAREGGRGGLQLLRQHLGHLRSPLNVSVARLLSRCQDP